MIWWLRSTVTWGYVAITVSSVAVWAFFHEIRLPYPTLGGGLFHSSSIATLLAIGPSVVWLRVRARSRREQALGRVRLFPIAADLGLAMTPPLLAAAGVAIGSAGARVAIVPAITYAGLALIAAVPQIPKEFRVLPAATLAIALLVGTANKLIPLTLVLDEAAEIASLTVSVVGFFAASTAFVWCSIIRRD